MCNAINWCYLINDENQTRRKNEMSSCFWIYCLMLLGFSAPHWIKSLQWTETDPRWWHISYWAPKAFSVSLCSGRNDVTVFSLWKLTSSGIQPNCLLVPLPDECVLKLCWFLFAKFGLLFFLSKSDNFHRVCSVISIHFDKMTCSRNFISALENQSLLPTQV